MDGLRYFDKEEGRGKEIKAGDTVVVSRGSPLKGAPLSAIQTASNAAAAATAAYKASCKYYSSSRSAVHPSNPVLKLSALPWAWLSCALLAVQVHFDCRFRGIDAVSSRYARTLGGNRTIAEVSSGPPQPAMRWQACHMTAAKQVLLCFRWRPCRSIGRRSSTVLR